MRSGKATIHRLHDEPGLSSACLRRRDALAFRVVGSPCDHSERLNLMRTSRFALTLAATAMLVSCGGDDNAPAALAPSPVAGGGNVGTAGCTMAQRLDFIDDVMGDWYLFPNLVAANVSRAGVTDPQDYIDDLVAPARAQDIDRFFSFITSIEEEERFANSGATAGFGFRLSFDASGRLFIIDSFEGASALSANIDRGTEILGIGTAASNVQTVSSLIANGGGGGVSAALGPNTPGVSRVLRIRDQAGIQRDVSLTKTSFALDPISDRFGTQIINDGGKQVGYINLRTFSVVSAEDDLRAAFAQFRAAGITELIIDLRYNGGGRVSVAETFGDLLGRGLSGEIYSQIEFRAERADNNSIHRFNPGPESIAPARIAFIGTRSTASASELVINSIQPYVNDIALIGENTFGKPVGQSGFDLAACDDRFRPVTIQITNRDSQGEYFTGLASTVPTTCRAPDDLSRQLGDPNEAMVATALDYLAGRSCTAIVSSDVGVQSVDDRGPLMPDLRDMSYAQYDVPGLF